MVSPLTEAVLGETLLTVTEEKVSITQLQAQVVASLALSLRPSPGSSHTILATTAAQQTLSFLKQVTSHLGLLPPQTGASGVQKEDSPVPLHLPALCLGCLGKVSPAGFATLSSVHWSSEGGHSCPMSGQYPYLTLEP